MSKELFNISNHLSPTWGEEQKKGWDIIIDVPFPHIDPLASTEKVRDLARGLFVSVVRSRYADYKKVRLTGKTVSEPENNPVIVRRLITGTIWHIAGEFSFTYALTSMVRQWGGKVVVACSERHAIEEKQPDGSVRKTAVFTFRQWREVK